MNMPRKLASLLLAMILVLCAVTPAMAAQEGTLTGGSITIDNAVEGQTYNAYQILYLESYNVDSNAYAYKANSVWEAWLKTQTTYVTIDAQGYVTWVEGADAAAFAKAAQAYAKTAPIAADATATANTTTVEFTGLNLGYYMVDSTLGVLCSLDTTKPNATIKEKNVAPINVKTVEEDSNKEYGDHNDADIGQTVNFKSTITAQAGAENYVFHDKMSEGLTYIGVTKITLNGQDVAAENNYTVKTTGLTDDCTFEVVFTQEFCDTLKANDKIVISYTATVNENAVIGLPGNPNESKLSYGDKSNTSTNTTPPSETITYTWDMDVLKYANGKEEDVLAGAEFVLLSKDTKKVATVANGKLTGWVDVPNANEGEEIKWPANTVLTTGENGKIEIDGLDADTYYLREIKAPDGYNKLANDVEVVIKGATETQGEDGNKKLTYTTVVAKVNNQSGTELPSTGGMGTTLFYVVGGVLVVAAFVLLVTKRRVGAEK